MLHPTATQHFALRPKSDLVLLYGIAHILIARGWIDRAYIDAHTNGFESSPHTSMRSIPERSSEATGTVGRRHRALRADDPRGRARVVLVDDGRQPEPRGRAHRAGDHQPRADDRQHRPARHRRQLDHRPVQRDGLAALQQHDEPARRPRLHRTQADRAKVAGILGIDAGTDPRPQQPGLRPDHRGHPRRADQGPVGHRDQLGPLVDQPDRTCTTCSDRLEFLVVQDMYSTTETAQRADLVLPAAGWGEKEGTFINSERRIGLVKRVVARAGPGARRLLHLQAHRRRLGLRRHVRGVAIARGVFQILKRLSPRPAVRLHRHRRLPDDRRVRRDPVAVPGRRGRRTATGAAAVRGRPLLPPRRPCAVPASRTRVRFAETTSKRYPLVLLTGRGSASQWHTETRTAKSADAAVARGAASPYVEISPADADARRISPDDWVIVASARGSMRARAFVTSTVAPGQVFVPDARRDDEPADRFVVRPLLAPAVVQALRRRGQSRVAERTPEPDGSSDDAAFAQLLELGVPELEQLAVELRVVLAEQGARVTRVATPTCGSGSPGRRTSRRGVPSARPSRDRGGGRCASRSPVSNTALHGTPLALHLVHHVELVALRSSTPRSARAPGPSSASASRRSTTPRVR